MERNADSKAASSNSLAETMLGTDVPSDDHIVRYVKPSMIRENGTVIGNVFSLRPNWKKETGVSVDWLEAFDGDKMFQIANARLAIKKRLCVSKNGRLAELNVGEVCQNVYEELEILQMSKLRTVRIVHKPRAAKKGRVADLSHAEIINLPKGGTPEATMVGDIIAECVRDTHPTTD